MDDTLSRQRDAHRLKIKYPDRVAVIVKARTGGDTQKLLVPGTLMFGAFMHIVRKRIKLNSIQALVGFVEGTLPPSSLPMSELPKNEDGFVYVTYSLENTFG